MSTFGKRGIKVFFGAVFLIILLAMNAVMGIAGVIKKDKIIVFDSKNKYSSVRINETNYIKGAPEVLLKYCNTYYTLDGDIKTLQQFTNNNHDDIVALQNRLADVTNIMDFIGVSTTQPTSDGKVTINGEVVQANKGDVVIYGNSEYVYDGTYFIEYGDTTAVQAAITSLRTDLTSESSARENSDTELGNRCTNIEVSIGGLEKDISDLRTDVENIDAKITKISLDFIDNLFN